MSRTSRAPIGASLEIGAGSCGWGSGRRGVVRGGAGEGGPRRDGEEAGDREDHFLSCSNHFFLNTDRRRLPVGGSGEPAPSRVSPNWTEGILLTARHASI